MNSPGQTETTDEWKEISVDTKLQNPTAPRDPWRIEERRILAANAYRVDWWQTFSTREAALAEFDAVLSKAAEGFYDATVPETASRPQSLGRPHAEYRLVLLAVGGAK